ncbi:MAG: stage III sporulation protein AA [Clostridia bacterium]|nr:stage III sporulation protein AA [Clostridia bacterium]
MKREEILRLFPGTIREILKQAPWDSELLQEIRLRAGKPLILWQDGTEYFVSMQGILTHHRELAYLVRQEEIRTTMEYLSQYSLYAYEEELRQGFLTIQGGHRVGVTGKIILEKHQVKGVQQIACINIRFSHQVMGCADKILPFVIQSDQVCHTLIISPPRCGKTTLLRDLVRQISDGTDRFAGCTVGVVDERSEIGGSYQGIPQNDVGIRTDLLDCCPKSEGMMMLIRSMSPAVIAVDELGNYEDINAIEMTLNCGCKLLATVHGSSIEEIQQKPLLNRLMKEHIFERYIILQNENRCAAGNVSEIYDGRGTCLYQRESKI